MVTVTTIKMVKLTSFMLATAIGMLSVAAIPSSPVTNGTNISVPFNNSTTNSPGPSACGGSLGSGLYNESSVVPVDSPPTNVTGPAVCDNNAEARCGDVTFCANWVYNADWNSVTSICTTMLCRLNTICYNFIQGTDHTLSAIKLPSTMYCFLYE